MKRITKQGEVISSVIRFAGRPLTPVEVHELAANKIPQLGIATTYRHLKSLTESNQVVGVGLPRSTTPLRMGRWQRQSTFCLPILRQTFFALEDTSEDKSPAKVPKGFKVQGFEVMLYGVCPECG